jgi:argininosuccinate lyase
MTTGSSIMPHKKNPDVFELLRAHCNRIAGIPGDIRLITGNLPSGYFRDMQLVKELFIPMFDEMSDCLDIACYAIQNIKVKEGLMDDPRYALAFSVEKVNALAASGVPFRDAYKQVAAEIGEGTFKYDGQLNHTHEGSTGNLCNDRVAARMQKITAGFNFQKIDQAVESLLG